MLIVLSGILTLPFPSAVLAQSGSCSTSGPASGAYTITVCITSPADDAVLKGYTSVKATASVTGRDPGIQKLVFYLGGQYLLTDYETDYTFILPTTKFANASRILEAAAILRDGFTSTRARIEVTFDNDILRTPVNRNTFTPTTGTTPRPDRPFVLAATGDGASGEENADAVVDLIAGWKANMLLYLGDVYDSGTFTEFYNWYGTESQHYSRLRAITNPTVGNHEYLGSQASGYFDYWNNVPNYYSVNAAGWHIISLNSTGQFDQRSPGTDQYDWLVRDLITNKAACTIVYFHHPLYNIGPEGEAEKMRQIWALLVEHGVDVVLTGHDHNYQRWHPLDEQGTPTLKGVTQFVVGTGGHGIQEFVRKDPRMAAGVDTPPEAFGALRMELNPDGAAYQFVNIKGITLDSGSIACSGAEPDGMPPQAPTKLTATSSMATEVDLSWTSATDNVGVTNYDIYRDGQLLATTNAVTSYTDNTVSSGTEYEYQIRARDAAGKVSDVSAAVRVTASHVLFSDGFETGDFSQWTGVSGLVIQKQHVYVGRFAVRGVSRDRPTHAYKELPQVHRELYYQLSFKILQKGTNTVYLQRFRTSRNSAILGVFISNTGRLGIRNDVTAMSTTSSTLITPNTWHDLQTRVQINGAVSEVEVWLDGVRVTELSKTENLGTTPIGRIQLGDNARGRIYDIALDRIALSTQFISSFHLPERTSLPLIFGTSSKPIWQLPDLDR